MAAIIKGDCMKNNNLFHLKKFTPLSEVAERIDADDYLCDSLYRIESGLYLYLTKFGASSAEYAGPFLSGLFCAPDDGSIMRATALDVEKDVGILLVPPVGFLPPEVIPEYGIILDWLKSMRPKVLQEAASYRIASDGRFVHRTIETEKYTFYFRGASDDNNERPYAILYKY